MNLESLIQSNLGSILEEYGFVKVSSKILGRDPKTGQKIEVVEFESPIGQMLVERIDGEINAKVRNGGEWKYIRSFDPERSEMSIEKLLQDIPNCPRGDAEMVDSLKKYLLIALSVLGNET